jgi:tetratricopeptide (TPR) repeat protein
VIEIPLIRNENYPSLIFQTKIEAIENIGEFVSRVNEQSNEEERIQRMWSDGEAANQEFETRGNLQSLEQAISKFEAIAKMIPENDPRVPDILGNLGEFLVHRFEQLGKIEDLNDGIKRLEMAVAMTSDSAPDKPIRLSDLGSSLRMRFGRLGNLADIDRAIIEQQAAVSLTPDGHYNKPVYLNNLGNCFANRFGRTDDLADLNGALIQQRAAVDLTPDGHTKKPIYLNNLGNTLGTRFVLLENLADIDDSIIQLQAAVNLTPNGHPNKSGYLSNLGSSLRIRFDRLQNLVDLDSAIIQQEAAVNFTPDRHPNKPTYLSNLGTSLQRRFKRLGSLADIDGSITHYQAAVILIPEGHPNKPAYLTSLGGSLQLRFQRLENVVDIHTAVLHQQTAVNLIPEDHPSKPGYLMNLGNSLGIRFERLGDTSDIDSSVIHHQAAVNLAPDGHIDKPMFLVNLGNALGSRFRRLGDVADLDRAIIQHELAAGLVPDDHPDKPEYLVNLGLTHEIRFLQFSHYDDAQMAISYFSAPAKSSLGSPRVRFEAAKRWISLASRISHQSLLDAHECALDLMPLIAWLGLPIQDRHEHLTQIGGIVRDAAAAAISLERYDQALEWLEQGRSIVWNQILQLRTPVDELSSIDPDLANRLVQVSRLLDRGIKQEDGTGSMQEDARQYRVLTAEWESIVEQVRALPNFDRFLKPPKVSQLNNAAQDGPVVVFNISEKRCDALALVAGIEEVIHIPLPNITSKRITELRDELKNLLYSSGIRLRGVRAAHQWTEESDSDDCKSILAEIWTGLAKPVLDSLAFSVRITSPLKEELLTVVSLDSSGCASTYLVVSNWATCFPPSTHGWHIRCGVEGLTYQ